MNRLNQFVAISLIVIVAAMPTYSVADDAGATLRTQGHVSVDGNPALPFAAIFPNSRIETEKNSSALLELSGSRVEIGAETIIEFENNELRLEHGSLSVLTFRSLAVRVGCILAVPVRSEETLFTTVDDSGRVTVSAVRNDVNINTTAKRSKQVADKDRPEQVTVRQGEQKSRDEKCGASPFETRTVAAGIQGLFNSPYAQGLAAAGIVVTLCLVFCFGGDEPASPSVP